MQDAGLDERVTVADAAERLGISKEAVRKRIARGTLRADKDADGTVRVYVPPSETASRTAASSELLEELRDRIRYLERQVEEERSARYRADELLAQLMQRVPQIEAPREEPRESPESAAAEQQGRGPVPDVEGAQEPTQRPQEERRGLWQRLFGG
jgi:predicted ArsR family transcriptional regulator